MKRAEAKRDEFRPSRYTSGSANVDSMIALGKALILCPDHTRKFSPTKAKYRAHPAYKRVIGNCDWCQHCGLNFLFLNGEQADEEHRKLERFKRAAEYGTFVR